MSFFQFEAVSNFVQAQLKPILGRLNGHSGQLDALLQRLIALEQKLEPVFKQLEEYEAYKAADIPFAAPATPPPLPAPPLQGVIPNADKPSEEKPA